MRRKIIFKLCCISEDRTQQAQQILLLSRTVPFLLVPKKPGMIQPIGQICIDSIISDMFTKRGPLQILGSGFDFSKNC